MNKRITITLSIVLFCMLCSYSYAHASFQDVSMYEEEIGFLTSKGIIKGFEGGTFQPHQTITRLQAVQMILREKELDASQIDSPDPNFIDVRPGDYGYDEIALAVDLGFISGGTNEKGKRYFNKNGTLTRGQMAKILSLAYDLKGEYIEEFSDVPRDHWAFEYVNLLAANNITTGYDDGTFRPNHMLARQHFAVFLARILDDRFKELEVTNRELLIFADLAYEDLRGTAGKYIWEIDKDIFKRQSVKENISEVFDWQILRFIQMDNPDDFNVFWRNILPIDGFAGVALKRGDHVVIAFRGTEFTERNLNDIQQDLDLGVPDLPNFHNPNQSNYLDFEYEMEHLKSGLVEDPTPQQNSADIFTAGILSDFVDQNDVVFLTGHSLGGYLAQITTVTTNQKILDELLDLPENALLSLFKNSDRYKEVEKELAAVKSNMRNNLYSDISKTVTFNAPGIFDFTTNMQKKYSDTITNYVIGNDLVGNFKEHIGKEINIGEADGLMKNHGVDNFYSLFPKSRHTIDYEFHSMLKQGSLRLDSNSLRTFNSIELGATPISVINRFGEPVYELLNPIYDKSYKMLVYNWELDLHFDDERLYYIQFNLPDLSLRGKQEFLYVLGTPSESMEMNDFLLDGNVYKKAYEYYFKYGQYTLKIVYAEEENRILLIDFYTKINRN